MHAGDPVEIIPYHPTWPRRFDAAARFLRRRFGPRLISDVAHVGSTAIPGMPAKPVLDILVEVASFDDARAHILPPLTAEGWEYIWRDDRPPGHMMFIRRRRDGRRCDESCDGGAQIAHQGSLLLRIRHGATNTNTTAPGVGTAEPIRNPRSAEVGKPPPTKSI